MNSSYRLHLETACEHLAGLGAKGLQAGRRSPVVPSNDAMP